MAIPSLCSTGSRSLMTPQPTIPMLDVVVLNNDCTSAEPALTSTNAAPAPTMASMMLMLHTMQNTMQTTNQAILTRLNTINSANKLQHGRLRAAINAKADSTEIA
jgi:hypothetical protein